ncbi:MAG: hypothetical protein V1807_01420 [Patescibacteria group bacterium]
MADEELLQPEDELIPDEEEEEEGEQEEEEPQPRRTTRQNRRSRPEGKQKNQQPKEKIPAKKTEGKTAASTPKFKPGIKARAGKSTGKPSVAELGKDAFEFAKGNVAQRAGKAIEVAQKVARSSKGTGQAVATGARVVAAFLTSPAGWITMAIILVVVIFMAIFMSGKNYINSLAGGSLFMAANYDSAEDRAIVNDLQAKMSGCDPKLVVSDESKEDLNWQFDDTTGKFHHRLDIRLLKTLDYLTDIHQRIRVDLLKTGGPVILRDDIVIGLDQYSYRTDSAILPPDWNDMSTADRISYIGGLSADDRKALEKLETKETLSAFNTGQAMAITEIDRSVIPELQSADTACGLPVAAPVAVNWQKTTMQKIVRNTWEELAYTVGFLDKQISVLENFYSDTSDLTLKTVQGYKNDLANGRYARGLLRMIFEKFHRTQELLERVDSWSNQANLASDTKEHFNIALAKVQYLNAVIGINDLDSYDEVNLIPDSELTDRVKGLGSPANTRSLRELIDNVYRGTQVANMVGWAEGDLDYREAYEARHKIRLVIQELMAMPNKTTLSTDPETINNPAHFDESLVVKQIITFSPEDDLDNGPSGRDVFPFGIDAVGDEGVSMNNSGADGKYTYADIHFSHSPIDNGVFSKYGTNWIYSIINGVPPVTTIAQKFLAVPEAIANFFINKVKKRLTELPPFPITYQKFLYVAF